MNLLPGVYEAVVVRHGWETARTGTPGLWVIVSLRDEFGSEEEMTGHIWMSKKSMGMARAQLKGLGFEVDKHDLDELGDTISLTGNECQVELGEEEYGGKKTLKIKWFGNRMPPPDKAKLSKISEQLRKVKKTATEEDAPPASELPGVPRSQTRNPPPDIDPDPEDEDIPF